MSALFYLLGDTKFVNCEDDVGELGLFRLSEPISSFGIANAAFILRCIVFHIDYFINVLKLKFQNETLKS